ncbi:MAG TPA: Ig domain-containing protein [Verrucomicrobiae bacterium]
MKLSFFKVGLRVAIFQLGLLLCQNLTAAVTFTVTPNVVSNTYIGPITMLISNIPAGGTVVIQKFADLNSNGVIDAGDVLVQQFNLTDNQAGMVIGGVTNFFVPFDYNSTTGTITGILAFPAGDFSQKIIGQYLFKLSSSSGQLTNTFNVTNFPYAQKITGTVTNNGANVPDASVILFPASQGGDNGPGTPVAGTVANSSGVYNVQVPPGSYVPMAFKSNYVANYLASPVLTLTNGQTITTNLALTIATSRISGQIIDATNSNIGLPGVFMPAINNGLIAIGFTDTNGSFNIPVTSGQWQIGSSDEGLIVHGYVGYHDGTNVNASTTGIVGPFYKANALFYGTVKDGSGNPLQGIPIQAQDQPNNGDDGEFDTDGYEDANGNYVVAALGGVTGSGDPWVVSVDNQSEFPNYIFSQSALEQNGGTNLAAGQAVLQNFTVLVATNHITGNVQFNGTNVVGVQVDAYATVNDNSYQAQADTDANGNYSLNVANGNWNVEVYDCGCDDDDSLNNILGNGNYQDPDSQNVTINNTNATGVDFTIQSCGGVQITTTSPLPDGTNGVSYFLQLQASSCNNNFTWSLNDPSNFPPGLAFDPIGEIFNTPSASGTYNFSVHVTDGNGNSTNMTFSIYIAPAATPLQITTTSLPNGTNGTFYSQTLQASGGQTPYSWAIADYSALPSNLALATNGVLSGTLSDTADTYYFDVIVTDAAANSITNTLSLTVVNPPLPPLVITNTSLPNGNLGVPYSAQLGATGGQSPYYWDYALGSQNLSLIGLSLNSSGLISGTPTTNRVFSFKVQVTDSNVSDPPTNKVLSITVNSKPVLSSPAWLTNQFQMQLTGAANQGYTIQMSTNLGSTNWISLFITNNATTNSFMVIDPNATNKQRFYRTLIGP